MASFPCQPVDDPRMSKCICRGNWRSIIEENEPLFDRSYTRDGQGEYKFIGVLWASDDFYYAMREVDTKNTIMLTCVGRLSDMGFVVK